MSEPSAREPIENDPLLQFFTETPAAPAAATAAPVEAQPVAPPIVPPQPTDSTALDARFETMKSRIDALQRSIDDTRKQLTGVKSEIATLVRATENNNKRTVRPAPPMRGAAPLPSRSSRYRVGSAIGGVVVGVVAGVMIWIQLSGVHEPVVQHETPQVESVAPASTQSAEPQPVAVQAAAVVPVSVTPPRAPQTVADEPAKPRANYTGTLAIDSDPGGEVFINRQTAGRTPLRVPNLRAGAHLVWIERDGYRRFTRVVEVPADRVTRLSASLEPLSAR